VSNAKNKIISAPVDGQKRAVFAAIRSAAAKHKTAIGCGACGDEHKAIRPGIAIEQFYCDTPLRNGHFL
jgi:hypothetical protein